MNLKFRDRTEAGQVLAQNLAHYRNKPGLLVLGLARGGVPVACEVARELNAQLDVFIARKLGVPGHEEFAMGAIASGGVVVIDQQTVATLRIPPSVVDLAIERESAELRRREWRYRSNHPGINVKGRSVILVDDGIATGATMRAAVDSLRQMGAGRIVMAAPVAALTSIWDLRERVDEFVAVITPAEFGAVGNWYENFSQVSDGEVRELLSQMNPVLKAA